MIENSTFSNISLKGLEYMQHVTFIELIDILLTEAKSAARLCLLSSYRKILL